MSQYYEPQSWQAPASRQVSWEQPVPPSRSGMDFVDSAQNGTKLYISIYSRSVSTGSSSVSQREDSPAFSSQFDEVDRAIDNLVKSGKLWNAPRRDSMPMMMGRPYPDYDPRMAGGGPQRHHSISEFEGSRMHPSGGNVQGFYASQRYQGHQGHQGSQGPPGPQGRPNEVEQMMQAKRRMAAQRERELRNYHQEQQYNRSLLAEMSASKSDRSVSPAAVSEESRRDLLARQHRALYGNESPAFFPPGPLPDDNSRPESQAGGTPSSAGVRGASPRGVDLFGLAQPGASVDGASGLQSPSRANSTSSPSSAINAGFPEQPVPSTSSPTAADSASRQPSVKSTGGPIGSGSVANSVGPIGSRPVPGQTSAPAANPEAAAVANERSTSASSNPAVTAAAAAGPKEASSGVGLGWSNGSGVWGSKSGLGVQASVWG
ncbi:hypothetical protein N7468_007989 [Penicillium chermesinum]|uniref:Uncharacterized protein n=1 Tax=Penicillium chermesinum TaxID=63820 RepID=A0A9W9NNW1_9EURO|nr:uncharacterized protein N7468_007989 [Penicillium chermesinum]KAJ5223447.1 hypothetical protein N7468_007989 [Penicillium chermesinum]